MKMAERRLTSRQLNCIWIARQLRRQRRWWFLFNTLDSQYLQADRVPWQIHHMRYKAIVSRMTLRSLTRHRITSPRPAVASVRATRERSAGTASRCSGRSRRAAPVSCAPASRRPLVATSWTAAWRARSVSGARRRGWGRGSSSRSGDTWPWRSTATRTPPWVDGAQRRSESTRCRPSGRSDCSGCCGRGSGRSRPPLGRRRPSSWGRSTRACDAAPRRAPARPSGSWRTRPPGCAPPTMRNSLRTMWNSVHKYRWKFT